MGRKRGKFFNMVLETIGEVQKRNQEDPNEPTAAANVFDIIREKVVEARKQNGAVHAEKRGEMAKNIFDMLMDKVDEAKQQNEDDPNVENAPGVIFDVIKEQIQKAQKKTDNKSLRDVVEEYNIDMNGVDKDIVKRLRVEYLKERKALRQKYAMALAKLSDDATGRRQSQSVKSTTSKSTSNKSNRSSGGRTRVKSSKSRK